MYWKQTASVLTSTATSEEFEVKRGVLKTRMCAVPILFDLYRDKIFKDDLAGVRMGSEEYSNLRYADDTVLIAETIKELQQELVNEVKERSLAKGLRMKTMVIRRNEK